MESQGKILFQILKVFRDAELEGKFLKRIHEDMIEDRDCKKIDWCETTTEFREK
jgi:hypothetical protein